jgi:hypothetical protein
MDEYSVSVRLHRVTTESAHVSIHITADLIRVDSGDPETGTLDAEKIFQAAIEQGRQDSTTWTQDGDALIELHPTQMPSEDA